MVYRRRFNRRPPSTTNLIRGELLDAMREPGCILCGLAQQKSLRYVDALLESAIMDVEQRDDWRYAGGFCQAHAEMALTLPNAAGSLAILYEDVLQYEMAGLAKLLREAAFSWRQRLRQRAQRWLQARRKRAPCPVCRAWRSQEELYWAVLLDHGGDDEVINAFSRSDGLCLPHTASLLRHGAGHRHLLAVLTAQQHCLQRLHGDLHAFIRKQDYRFAQEPYGREADAWRRVVACLAGRWRGRDRE